MGSAKQRKSGGGRRRLVCDRTVAHNNTNTTSANRPAGFGRSHVTRNAPAFGQSHGMELAAASTCSDSNEVKVCEYCHRKGTSGEFYSTTKRFCSVGCCHRFSASHQRKRLPKPTSQSGTSRSKAGKVVLDASSSFTQYDEVRQDFDWQDYLIDCGAIAAPSHCFPLREFPAVDSNVFAVGMKLEVSGLSECPHNCHLATVTQYFGVHVALTFDGCPPGHDGIVKVVDSPELHPVGWASSVGGKVIPPVGALEEYSNDWDNFIKQALQDASLVASSAFTKPKESVDMQFSVGQKLELELSANVSDSACGDSKEDGLLSSEFRVATIAKVSETGERVSLQLDGHDDEKWIEREASSPFLHPVRYCEENQLRLEPPEGATEDYFNWSSYLAFSKSVAAPRELFTKSNNMFQPGMKIEAMDIHNPPLVCVATISDVHHSQILIHFDGWSSEFDYWADHRSLNIFPVGWCEKHHYILQTPPQDEVGELLEESDRIKLDAEDHDDDYVCITNPGRKRQTDGSVPKQLTRSKDNFESSRNAHSYFNQDKYDGAPRAVFNIACSPGPRLSAAKLDSLPREVCGSTVSSVLRCVLQHLIDCGINSMHIFHEIEAGHSDATVQYITKTGQRVIKHIQHVEQPQQLWTAISTVLSNLECCINFVQPHGATGRCPLCTGNGAANSSECVDGVGVIMSSASQNPTSSAYNVTVPVSSQSRLDGVTSYSTPSYPVIGHPSQVTPSPCHHQPGDDKPTSKPSAWSVSEVKTYLESTDCADMALQLSEQDIDGKALMLLTPDMLVKYMNIRLGPALKICNYITVLKTKWNL